VAESVHVITAIDSRYLPFAAALVATLAEHREPSTSVELTILHAGDVATADRARIACAAPGVDVTWQVVSGDLYARYGLRLSGVIARPAYFRCLVPDLLSSAEWAIYLDADTLVFADLRELHDVDLRGAPVGAVQDWLPTVRDAVGPWRHLGLDPDAPYFNSGVLVMDLVQWRRENAGAEALRRCLQDEQHLIVRGVWPQHDQYGLNIVFHRRWHQLPSMWNHFSELSPDSARIVHLVGNGKPWDRRCKPEFAHAFYSAVDRSPWAGWRKP
jgi:lipopolysaccharide biosynthesis glycosyltransferase